MSIAVRQTIAVISGALRVPLKHPRASFLYGGVAVAVSLLCLLSIAAFDRMIARFVQNHAGPDYVLSAPTLTAITACGFFIFILALVYEYLLAEAKNSKAHTRLFAVIASLICALCFCEVARVTLGRIGPSEYLQTGAYGFHYFAFLLDSDHSTFPSEYCAIVGVAAAAMWMLVPTYRPTIVLLAVLVASNQLLLGTYFLSDILGGLVIGISSFLIIDHVLGKSPEKPSEIA